MLNDQGPKGLRPLNHIVPYTPCLDLCSEISLDEEIQTGVHLGQG